MNSNLNKSQDQKQRKKILKHYSMKTLEKSIQNKILDISLKIGDESMIIKEKLSKINVGAFIKKKLGKDESINLSSSKDNILRKKKKNNTINGKKVIFLVTFNLKLMEFFY